jgi:hypothetical protein
MKKQGSKPMEQAAARLIETGQLVRSEGGSYRFLEYVDDLDVYVAKRSAGSSKFQKLVRTRAAKRGRLR